MAVLGKRIIKMLDVISWPLPALPEKFPCRGAAADHLWDSSFCWDVYLPRLLGCGTHRLFDSSVVQTGSIWLTTGFYSCHRWFMVVHPFIMVDDIVEL